MDGVEGVKKSGGCDRIDRGAVTNYCNPPGYPPFFGGNNNSMERSRWRPHEAPRINPELITDHGGARLMLEPAKGFKNVAIVRRASSTVLGNADFFGIDGPDCSIWWSVPPL